MEVIILTDKCKSMQIFGKSSAEVGKDAMGYFEWCLTTIKVNATSIKAPLSAELGVSRCGKHRIRSHHL
jgi:hypothetical protein